jgi:hypothetical protein
MTNVPQPNKLSVFTGFTNLLKNGGDKLKEKFTNIFKDKKDQPSTSPGKLQFKQNNVDNKKPIFTIEEDDEHKIYHYGDEDEEDYDYDDHDDIKEESKTDDKPKRVVSPKTVSPKAIQEKANTESQVKQEDEVLEDFDPYDIHTVCHRIYVRDSTIDLEGMNYVKCKRFKNKSKILSMIGVFNILI